MNYVLHLNTFKIHFNSDWETAQPKADELGSDTTQRLTKHVPTGFGFITVSPYEEFNCDVTVYRGVDCVTKFFNCLEEIYDKSYTRLNTVRKMIFTNEDHADFNSATECSICTEPLEENDILGPKVPDHDHINGKYRGSAHMNCNLQMKQQKAIIIYMHNAKGSVTILLSLFKSARFSMKKH